jgi:hypothetical protein
MEHGDIATTSSVIAEIARGEAGPAAGVAARERPPQKASIARI